MLIYDPTLDPYHCAIRILAISEYCPTKELPVEAVRIADYYLAYPDKIASIRLPSELRRIRKSSASFATPYRSVPEPKLTFERMRAVFNAALSSLTAAGFLDPEQIAKGSVARSEERLSNEISSLIDSYLNRQQEIREFIVKELATVRLLGNDGLKHRTGLLEHRYDPI